MITRYTHSLTHSLTRTLPLFVRTFFILDYRTSIKCLLSRVEYIQSRRVSGRCITLITWSSSIAHMLRAIRRSFRKSSKRDKAPQARLSDGADLSQNDDRVIDLGRQQSAQDLQLPEVPLLLSSASASSTSSSLTSLVDDIGQLEVIEEMGSADTAVERQSLPPSLSVSSTTTKSSSVYNPEQYEHATTEVDRLHLVNSSAVVTDHNDSGFGVEIIGHHDESERQLATTEINRRLRLQRQEELMVKNSNSSDDYGSTVVTNSQSSSLNSSLRHRRHRAALRSFRYRSQEFLRRTFRPSCVRPSSDVADDNDAAYVPSAGLGDIVTAVSPPPTRSLTVDTSAKSSLSLKRNINRRVALSHQLMRYAIAGSSSADIRLLVRDVDAMSAVAVANATSVGTGAGASTFFCHSLQSSNSDLATQPSSIEADVSMDRLTGDAVSEQSFPSSSSSMDQVRVVLCLCFRQLQIALMMCIVIANSNTNVVYKSGGIK